MDTNTYDFSGWVTKNDIKCTDGRVIRQDAFKHNDGQIVPLVWMHDHKDPFNVLGNVLLENRREGVYGWGKFNSTEQGLNAKELVQHGDVTSLSIHANKLRQKGSDVLHGDIKEVSLVLAGANIGAHIDNIIMHGEESSEEATMYFNDGTGLKLYHDDESELEPEEVENIDEEPEEPIKHADESKEDNKMKEEKTVQQVIDGMSEDEKNVLYFLVNEAKKGKAGKTEDEPEDEKEVTHSEELGGNEMKENVFDKQSESVNGRDTLSHDEMATIINDGKRYGSLKESFLAHAEEYGIDNIEYLFPEAREVNRIPEFIKRDTSWVQKVMSGVHKVPFSRIKTTFADITEDEARAKGYMKGKLKKEEVFSLLKRSTTPTTIYKKQKMDRDDVVDITDFDVVAWLKSEMRMMLDEEIARAILIGDGRLASSDDKINEQNIRPIIKDEELFTIQATVDVAKGASADDKAKEFIRTAIKARKNYKGSGQPTLFTTDDMLTDMLLLTDLNGRDMYESEAKLATKLRVKEIVVVPVMEGVKGKNDKPLMGLIVNLNDYDCGADKGGAINMFDDFDIDYNQQKYLIETRCSGAPVKPYCAIALTLNEATQ